MRILLLNTDPQTRIQYILHGMQSAFLRMPEVADCKLATYADVATISQDMKPDLFVAVGGSGCILEPVLQAIANSSQAVLWSTEDPYERAVNSKLSQYFDLYCTNEESIAKQSNGLVHFLPLAASVDHHNYPVRSASELDYDLFFMGTNWPNRVTELQDLLTLLPSGLKVKIGLHRNPHVPKMIGDIADTFTHFELAPEQFASFANHSAITLCLDRTFSAAAGTGEDWVPISPPPRIFEAAAAGSCQVYYTQRSGIAKLLEPDREIAIASTISDTALLINEILENPERRFDMATRSRARVLGEHTYDQRVRSLFNLLSSAQTGSKRPQLRADGVPVRMKRVLFVSHNRYGVPPYGGAELYQKTVMEHIEGTDFYTLHPGKGGNTILLTDKNGHVCDQISRPKTIIDQISQHETELFFQEVLVKYEIDLVHFHHFINLTPSLPRIAKSFGLPIVATTHDYYMSCQSFNLLSEPDPKLRRVASAG